VLAKTWRDEIMREMDAEFPGYDFAIHKGYGTARHQAALRLHKPSPIHRRLTSLSAN
jgi:ribonuclease HII